jgi:hypothetical protein
MVSRLQGSSVHRYSTIGEPHVDEHKLWEVLDRFC